MIRRVRNADRRALVSTVVLTIVAAVLAVVTLTAQGIPPQRVDLNDGGVWVTRTDTSSLARFVPAVQQINSEQRLEGLTGFDVLQNGKTVVAWNAGTGSLALIDPTRGGSKPPVTLAEAVDASLGGTPESPVLAILVKSTGAVFVLAPNEVPAFDPSQATPRLTAGSDATVAVAPTGAVAVVSPSSRSLITIPPDDAGAGETTELPAELTADSPVSVSFVGGRPVLLDAGGRFWGGGPVVALSDPGTRLHLQKPGPAGSAAVVAGTNGLYAVSLDDGSVRSLSESAVQAVDEDGAVAVPVRLPSGCAYGAFVGTEQILQVTGGCDASRTPRALLDPRGQPVPPAGKRNLVYRVNVGLAVLNDTSNGSLWDADADELKQFVWQPKDQEGSSESVPTTSVGTPADCRTGATAPRATDDEAGARPGLPVVIDVLRNDEDADCDVLSIDGVPQVVAGPKATKVELVGDGRLVQVTAPEGANGRIQLTYVVSDSRGGRDTGTVTIEVRTANEPPKLRGAESSTVVISGRSVSYAVLGDWIDPDGDPLQLTGAIAPNDEGVVRFQPDGLVTYDDGGDNVGEVTLVVIVSDGRVNVQGKLVVDVRAPEDLDPKARPDYARGTVGDVIKLDVLANDSDPNGDALRLLSVTPQFPEGPDWSVDLDAGTISLSATAAGDYGFTYQLGAGRGTATGFARISLEKPTGNRPPAAMVDLAGVPLNGDVAVQVLRNDVDPDGDVLAVTRVSSPDPAVSARIDKGATIRLRLVSAITAPVRVVYSVTDGSQQVDSYITVFLNSAGMTQKPMARADAVVVRAGSMTTISVLDNDVAGDGGALTLGRDLVTPAKVGLAAVNGSSIKYVAPATGGKDSFDYRLVAASDPTLRAVGSVSVTVLDPGATNSPPRPELVEARVVAGKIVSFSVPLDGIDPEGDLTYIDSVTPSPLLGGIPEVDRASQRITYRAGQATGTDRFTYRVCDVADPQLCADGVVKVGVYTRASNEAPAAGPDTVVMRPGKSLAVNVLANDSDPDGDTPRFAATDPVQVPKNSALKARVDDSGALLLIEAPNTATSTSLTYRITDGLNTSSGVVSVQVSDTAPAYAPVAVDDVVAAADVAANEAGLAVDVLANDVDPDGPAADLRAQLPDGSPATVSPDGRSIRVVPTDGWQSLPYFAVDRDGLQGMAFVIVPPAGQAPPVLAAGASVEVEAGQAVELDVSSLVTDPDGGPESVRLARAQGSVTASAGAVEPLSPTTFRYTAPTMDLAPPAQAVISLQVTDGTPTRDGVVVTQVSVPVIITAANRPPVVERTTYLVEQALDNPPAFDVTRTVSDPDVEDQGGPFTFEPVQGSEAGMTWSLDASGQLIATAVPDSDTTPAGATVEVRFTVADKRGLAFDKGVVFLTSVATTKPPLIAAPLTVERLDQGATVDVDIVGANQNPFEADGKPLTVTDVQVLDGAVVVGGPSDSLTISATADAKPGPAHIRYTVMDAANREATGVILVVVWGKPTDPTDIQKVSSTGSTITLSWTESQANTFTLDPAATTVRYNVTYTGRSTPLVVSDARIVIGDGTMGGPPLTPGEPYTVSVTAFNDVGESQPATAGPFTPDALPPVPVIAPEDTGDPSTFDVDSVQLTFQQPSPTDGASAIQRYDVVYQPQAPGAPKSIAGAPYGSARSVVLTGLTAGQRYFIQLCPINKEVLAQGITAPCGEDPTGRTPIGPPSPPSKPSVTGIAANPVVDTAVTATWPAVTGAGTGGDTTISYICTLHTSGGGAVGSPLEVSTTTCTFDRLTAGTQYVVGVSTKNDKATSGEVRSDPVTAIKQPATVQGVALTATGTTNQVRIDFTRLTDAGSGGAGAANVTYFYDVNNDANWRGPINPGTTTTNAFRNGVDAVVRIIARNGSGADSTPSAASNKVQPYGTVGVPSAGASVNGATATMTWGPTGDAAAVQYFDVRVTRDGAPVDTFRATNGGSRAYSNGTGVTWRIDVTAVGFGAAASQANAASVFIPNPPPPRNGQVYRGTSAVGQPGCSNSSCAYVGIEIWNYAPNTTYSVSINTSAGPLPSTTIRTDGNGYARQQTTRYFGYPTGWVSVTIDGSTWTRSPWL